VDGKSLSLEESVPRDNKVGVCRCWYGGTYPMGILMILIAEFDGNPVVS